jgi:hypothetical protein
MSGRKAENIVTEYTELSAFSASAKECDHHLIFGSGSRKQADEDGLILPLTNKEHNMGAIPERIHDNPAAEKLSKMLGQVAWELNYIAKLLAKLSGKTAKECRSEAREAFRKRYGISYL